MSWRVWTQYEPDTREGDIGEALAAALDDPLWLLSRQRQIGEFRGEDAGSPIRVEVETEFFAADRCVIGGRAHGYAAGALPLERIVEAEPSVEAPPDLRQRAWWGRLFGERLAAANLGELAKDIAERFGFGPEAMAAAETLDAASRLVVGRSPDAESLRLHFAEDPTTDAEIREAFPGIPDATIDASRSVVDAWLADYGAAIGQDAASAWLPERAEYGFSVRVPTDIGRVVLGAPEYHGGRLDWDALDIAAIDAGAPAAEGEVLRRTVLATEVTYLGMPAPRFWEFENAAVDFGDPGGGERDIGRLLLAEVALAWGNDWFAVPLELPTGGFVRINELLVTDTFGVTSRIPPQHANSPTWTMHRHSRSPELAAADDFLWLAPALPAGHDGAPIETVLFRRDEMANLAWAIEADVADAYGRPVDLRGTSARVVEPAPDGELRYRLVPDLPETWAPMVPVLAAGDTRYLVLAGLLDEDGLDPPEPRGVLLKLADPPRLHEAELTRAGMTLERHWQLARWYDGRRHLWVARRRRPGVGEIRSDLEFDRLLR